MRHGVQMRKQIMQSYFLTYPPSIAINRYSLAQGGDWCRRGDLSTLRASAGALWDPREVHTAASRSTPAWCTDQIMNRHIYERGHRDGHEGRGMFSFDEFPAIEVVKNGKIGSFGVGSCGSSAQVGSGSGLRDKLHVVHGVGHKLQRRDKSHIVHGVEGKLQDVRFYQV